MKQKTKDLIATLLITFVIVFIIGFIFFLMFYELQNYVCELCENETEWVRKNGIEINRTTI